MSTPLIRPHLPCTQYGTFSLIIEAPVSGTASSHPKETIGGIAKVVQVVQGIFSSQPKIGEEKD